MCIKILQILSELCNMCSQEKKNNNYIVPNVRDIVANPDDPIDPNLHREMDLVQYLLI